MDPDMSSGRRTTWTYTDRAIFNKVDEGHLITKYFYAGYQIVSETHDQIFMERIRETISGGYRDYGSW